MHVCASAGLNAEAANRPCSLDMKLAYIQLIQLLGDMRHMDAAGSWLAPSPLICLNHIERIQLVIILQLIPTRQMSGLLIACTHLKGACAAPSYE